MMSRIFRLCKQVLVRHPTKDHKIQGKQIRLCVSCYLHKGMFDTIHRKRVVGQVRGHVSGIEQNHRRNTAVCVVVRLSDLKLMSEAKRRSR